jgi:hypothetical protein
LVYLFSKAGHNSFAVWRCIRSHQRIEHPGGLDLIATTQRLDHALNVPPALTGILDEIEILLISVAIGFVLPTRYVR